MSLNRFDDVQVLAEEAGSGGIRLRYVLTPLHPVDTIEFRGMLGLPEDSLQRVVVDRFGASPRAARAPEIVEALACRVPAARIRQRADRFAPDRDAQPGPGDAHLRDRIRAAADDRRQALHAARCRRPGHADGSAGHQARPALRRRCDRARAARVGRLDARAAGFTRRAPATGAKSPRTAPSSR